MPEDEKHFFQAFEMVVGHLCLMSKSLGGKISGKEVFLDKNYQLYMFPENINQLFVTILGKFNSSGNLPSGSLSHNIDGFLYKHSNLGSRIIEFDEEQHFNPYRLVSLTELKRLSNSFYINSYIEYCRSIEYYHRMMQKHRLTIDTYSVPTQIKEFQSLIQSNAKSNNGYIKQKEGFDFCGGRIAQRAYYDTLRDVAHMSFKNKSLAAPLRLSQYFF